MPLIFNTNGKPSPSPRQLQWRRLCRELMHPDVELTVEEFAGLLATYKLLVAHGHKFEIGTRALMAVLERQAINTDDDSDSDGADERLDLEDSDEDAGDDGDEDGSDAGLDDFDVCDCDYGLEDDDPAGGNVEDGGEGYMGSDADIKFAYDPHPIKRRPSRARKGK